MDEPKIEDDLVQKGATLLKSAGTREVYVFGSIASGRQHPDSDVGIAVSGLPPAAAGRLLSVSPARKIEDAAVTLPRGRR